MARQIFQWAAIAAVYVVLGELGSLLALQPGVITSLWPPSGWALAIFILGGPTATVGIWLGAFIDTLLTLPGNQSESTALLVATLLATSASLQAATGAWLVQRQNFRIQLDRVEDVFYLLVLGGLAASTLSATIGTLTLTVAGIETFQQWTSNWLVWWLGDTLGVMLIAPLVFVLAHRTSEHIVATRQERTLWAGSFIAVVIGNLGPFVLMPLLAILLVVWAALRLGSRVTTLSIVGLALTMIYATHAKIGPFTAANQLEALLTLDRFLMALTLPTLVLMASLATHRAKESELQAMTLRLQELDKLKSNFVSSVSHELRTPLTSIMGYAEFLEDAVAGPLNSEQEQFVKQIQSSSKRLQRLVDDLLDFARIDAGTFRLRLMACDLGEKLTEVAESLKPLLQESGITLELDCPKSPLLVRMDPQRIEQVFINLITNAIKASPLNRQIQVAARLEGDHIRCEVIDQGGGIAPEAIGKLFHRFSRLETQSSGTGLGLSISRALIEAHGGTMGVESTLGLGSCFWFTLPLPPMSLDNHATEETFLNQGSQPQGSR